MKLCGLKITDIVWFSNRHQNSIEVYRINSRGDGTYHEYETTETSLTRIRKIASQPDMIMRYESETGDVERRTPYTSEIFVKIVNTRHSQEIHIMFRKNYGINDQRTNQ